MTRKECTSLLILAPPLLVAKMELLSICAVAPSSFALTVEKVGPQRIFPLRGVARVRGRCAGSNGLGSVIVHCQGRKVCRGFLIVGGSSMGVRNVLGTVLRCRPSISIHWE